MIHTIQDLFKQDNADFRSLVHQGAIIVDVRTVVEFNTAHLEGAINIPVDVIACKTEMLSKLKQPIITCCQCGSRSEMAKEILEKEGLTSYNGGAWHLLLDKIHD